MVTGDSLRPTCLPVSITFGWKYVLATEFAPYAANIKASGADTVITGNCGNDLSLLLRASKKAGL